GDRDEPQYRDAGRDESRRRRGGRGDVLRAEHRQGGDGLHADGDGGRERDQHGVQHHGGDGDPARVLRGAEHHGGGGGDHAGGAGDGAGCTGEHGDRVYGERHSSHRDEPGHGDARGDAHARRGGRGGNVRQPGD